MAMIEANTCLGSQKLFITNRNTSIYFNEFIHKILKKFCKEWIYLSTAQAERIYSVLKIGFNFIFFKMI